MADKKSESHNTASKGETNEAGQGVDSHVPSKKERAEMSTDKNYQAGKTGAVLDDNDGRLKENRDSGTSLGTTAHSATAPNVGRSND